MATEFGSDHISIAIAEDCRSYQYHVIAVNDGLRAVEADGLGLCGILMNSPNSGDFASLQVLGLSKAKAGGTLTAYQRVAITASGTLVAATSAMLYAIGFAIEAVASGGITPILIDRGAGGA